ncbi:MAG: AMP-binding protein, partial [Pseudomonadota bacterium]
RWIADQGITRLLIPPVLCAALAGSGGPGAVRTIFTGGGPVFPDIVKTLSRPGTRVVSVYGSTEAEPIARVESDEISAEDQRAMEAGCGILAGHPVPGLSLRIEDDEIQVSGAHVNQGYFDPSHDADTKLHQDGVVWHRTGDAGRLDGEGRLWLLGRLQDRFHAPGGPIYPFAVEVVARTWPGVDAAAFLAIDAVPILAVSGDAANLAEWEEAAKDCGIARVTAISEIPMDRRHRSKVDARTLAKRIKAKLGRVS